MVPRLAPELMAWAALLTLCGNTPGSLYTLPFLWGWNMMGAAIFKGLLDRLPLRKLMGLAVLHWSGMLFSNISVSEVHISFTHTVKADIRDIRCWRVLKLCEMEVISCELHYYVTVASFLYQPCNQRCPHRRANPCKSILHSYHSCLAYSQHFTTITPFSWKSPENCCRAIFCVRQLSLSSLPSLLQCLLVTSRPFVACLFLFVFFWTHQVCICFHQLQTINYPRVIQLSIWFSCYHR